MPKIITIRYGCGSFTVENPERTFRDAMDSLVDSYKRHGSQADFGIVDSAEIANICLSSMCFFSSGVQDAFQRQGIVDVKVSSMGGGFYDAVLEKIRESGGDVEYLDDVRDAENPVLYKFERSE